MMKLYKIIFFNTMILGSLISISSYSWMGMWMGLEINLLSIIPLFNSSKNMFSSESSLKYFITQVMASLILLMSVIMLLMSTEFINPQMNSSMLMILNCALLMKLGAAPFHFWFTEVMEGLSWINCMILMTWQKIAPMILIMNNKPMPLLIYTTIILSLLISVILSFNQTSLRKVMALSSINHIGWMLSNSISSFSMWSIYFCVYSVITINISYIMNLMKMFLMNQMSNCMNSNKLIKFSITINFLSLGGLPPFLGFLPKWLTINWLIYQNMELISFMMIVLTLIMLFIYIRIIMSSIMIIHSASKINLQLPEKFMFMSINMLTLSSLILCSFMMN